MTHAEILVASQCKEDKNWGSELARWKEAYYTTRPIVETPKGLCPGNENRTKSTSA